MRKESNEMFYVDDNGVKQDAELHAAMLDDEEADRAVSEMAVQDAIEDGMSEEDARELYGYRDTTAANKLAAAKIGSTEVSPTAEDMPELDPSRWDKFGGPGFGGEILDVDWDKVAKDAQ